jgi:glucokinase
MPASAVQLALGLDIGGSRTKLGLVESSGRIRVAQHFATDVREGGGAAFIDRLMLEIRRLYEPYRHEVIGIGASFLGWLNKAGTGPQFCMNAPALHQVDFRNLLADAFQLPVVVHDDVTAHTLAEFYYGGGRGSRRFLCLALGTGVGAGIMIDGKPLQFTGGCAGDTGHVILRPGGPTCASGCRGCGEALIGVAGIERLAVEKYADGRPAAALIQAAASGAEATAVQIMGDIGQLVGELLASLFPIFLPETMTLTGGTSRAGNVLLNAAVARFEELSGAYYRTYAGLPGADFRGPQILLSSLEGETGVIGAVTDLFQAPPATRSD